MCAECFFSGASGAVAAVFALQGASWLYSLRAGRGGLELGPSLNREEAPITSPSVSDTATEVGAGVLGTASAPITETQPELDRPEKTDVDGAESWAF